MSRERFLRRARRTLQSRRLRGGIDYDSYVGLVDPAPREAFADRLGLLDPPSPPTEERKPMPVEQRRGRILRSATKRWPLTAGELAVRSSLAAADGSGRAIAGDLAALVQDGQLVVHGRKGHYTYTKAA